MGTQSDGQRLSGCVGSGGPRPFIAMRGGRVGDGALKMRGSGWVWGQTFFPPMGAVSQLSWLFSERWCCLHPSRLLRPDWTWPSATWSDFWAVPALIRRLDWRFPEVPFHLNYPRILRKKTLAVAFIAPWIFPELHNVSRCKMICYKWITHLSCLSPRHTLMDFLYTLKFIIYAQFD